IAIRQQKIRVIENVERLPAELDGLPLAHGKILHQARLDRLPAWAVQNSTSGIPRRERQETVLVRRAVRGPRRARARLCATGGMHEDRRVKPWVIDPSLAGPHDVLAGGNAVR